MSKLYVLQHWFWEGDSYLVNSFCGIFDNVESVPEHIRNYIPAIQRYELNGQLHWYATDGAVKKTIPCKHKGFYTDSDIEQVPNESDGSYSVPGFYTFTSLTLNEFIESQ